MAMASRRITEFKDIYGIVLPYLNRFEFEDKEYYDYTPFYDSEEVDDYCVADPHKNILRYLQQIRDSFGFDVDCHAPSWFNGPFYAVDLSEVKYSDVTSYDEIIDTAKFAVDEINIDEQESGKIYKYVDVEKAVLTPNGLSLLTITTKVEDGDSTAIATAATNAGDVLATIQAIVYISFGRRFELEQWRFKPDPVAATLWCTEPVPASSRCSKLAIRFPSPIHPIML